MADFIVPPISNVNPQQVRHEIAKQKEIEKIKAKPPKERTPDDKFVLAMDKFEKIKNATAPVVIH